MAGKWTVFVGTLIGSVIIVLSENAATEIALRRRQILLQKELDMMPGSGMVLSDSELKANEIIMNMKLKELDFCFMNPQYFNFSKHFFDYNNEVNKSELFKLIQKMPKGAMLHAHDTGMLNADYVLKLTYWDNLYVCFNNNNTNFKFSKNQPNTPCETKWQLMKEARNASENVEKFDNDLKKIFTLVIDNPNDVYSDINAVWSKFQQYFINTDGLFTYKPVWEQYFYDTLKAARQDNIMYIEIRSVLPALYDLKGNVFDSVFTAQSYKNILDKFITDYPDFFGAKLIYAPLRLGNRETIKEHLSIASEIKEKLPKFFAGFDLVGQEDLGNPLKDFLPELIDASDEINYFFHAGETNWFGTNSDENLADAIVLGAKRIGHGYALIKHPVLMEEVKKNNIALEVNVISNKVLKLIEDSRNHPLASFLANGLPVVLSSDDPGLWDAEPLSHDFYVTFVGVASKHADLRLLKKLALNSLYYSSISNKDRIVHEFNIRWTRFIDDIVRGKW
ncbi:adenosine deaminase 2-like [Papilio machaon]|uniref:adenosine deaminase 2-like n=1 Tax=Papilio machaon TaxID=76193 RepID=UPI001E663D9F|nr:adenosine deaminase 2-like [Papilio machaon]